MLISAVALIVIPVAAGLATSALGLSPPTSIAALLAPLRSTLVTAPDTVLSAPDTLVTAPGTLVRVAGTLVRVADTVVTMVPAVEPARSRVPTVEPVLPLVVPPLATIAPSSTAAPRATSTSVGVGKANPARAIAALPSANQQDAAPAATGPTAAADLPTAEEPAAAVPAAPAAVAPAAAGPAPAVSAARLPAAVVPAEAVPAPAVSAAAVPAAAVPAAAQLERPPAQAECDTYDNPDTPCALSDGSVVSGYIRVQGGRSYFWFGVPTPDMHVSIRLTDLAADYDLYLFSDQAAEPQQPILSSVTPGVAPETIDTILHDVGTYAIEVVDDPSFPNAPDDPYTLSFGLQPAPAPATPEPTPLPTQAPTPTAQPAPSLASVPAVVGQSTNAATRVLRDAGLGVEVVTADAFSPSGEGTVASQDPQPATRLAPGSTVRLSIASGRVAIPSVHGRPEAEAYAILRAAGFDILTKRRADDALASGIALGTNPGDGAVLDAGTSIELLISQGH